MPALLDQVLQLASTAEGVAIWLWQPELPGSVMHVYDAHVLQNIYAQPRNSNNIIDLQVLVVTHLFGEKAGPSKKCRT